MQTLYQFVSSFQIQTDPLELTDGRLVLLSEEINQQRKLRKLAIVGLKMSDHVIESALQSNPDIVDAAYTVLEQWRKSDPDRTVAYTEICQTLRDVNMAMLIKDTLQ